MKKRLRRIKQFFNRYINGTKGAISLLLAIVMLPFSSTALLLVESARYQNAIELVNEMMDCIGLSTLGEYDSFLEERFGLLAMSQETAPSTSFSKYVNENMPALKYSFQKTTSSAHGLYPLSNKEVLKEQIMEYGEVTALAETLYNGLNVDKLLEELYKKLNLEQINKFAKATSSVADVASSTADLVDSVKTAIEEHKKYKEELVEYKASVSDFHIKSNSLITALITAKNNLAEGKALEEIYKVKAVKDAIKNCNDARDILKKEAGEMATAVSGMKGAVDSLFSTVNSIADKVYDANTDLDDVSDVSLKDKCTTSTSEWIIMVADELTNIIKTTVSSTYSADMQAQVNLLNAQKIKVGNVVFEKTTTPDSTKYYVNVNSSITQVKADFPEISINSVDSAFQNRLEDKIKTLDEKESSIDSAESASLAKMLDVAGELINVTAVYNGALDACVNPSSFYQYNARDKSFSSTALIYSLTSIVKAGDDFLDGLTKLNIFKALKAAAEFLFGIGAFLTSIVAWVFEVFVGLIKFVASGTEMYDTFLLAAYSVYNLPCRTTFRGSKSLSGYSYSKIFNDMGGISGDSFTGSLSDLETLMSASGTGTAKGFRGAEVEYLLIGHENELMNQSASFFNLYYLRMVLDLRAIFNDKLLPTLAGAATVASWVVYLAVIIAEPMIDTLILVNGAKLDLFKEHIYLSPAGIHSLCQILPDLSGLSQSVKDKIKDSMVAANGKAPGQGMFAMNYQEHMMVLLLLTVDQNKLLSRMQNLIQMEASKHYEGEYSFQLNNAYTYLEMNVTGKLNSMFDLDALTSGGPFTISRKRIVGY